MLEVNTFDYFNPILLNRGLVKALGYHPAAIIKAICEDLAHNPDKQRTLYFAISIKYLLNNTYLSGDEFIEALDKLRDEGIIKLNPEQPITDDNELYLSLNEEALEI